MARGGAATKAAPGPPGAKSGDPGATDQEGRANLGPQNGSEALAGIAGLPSWLFTTLSVDNHVCKSRFHENGFTKTVSRKPFHKNLFRKEQFHQRPIHEKSIHAGPIQGATSANLQPSTDLLQSDRLAGNSVAGHSPDALWTSRDWLSGEWSAAAPLHRDCFATGVSQRDELHGDWLSNSVRPEAGVANAGERRDLLFDQSKTKPRRLGPASRHLPRPGQPTN